MKSKIQITGGGKTSVAAAERLVWKGSFRWTDSTHTAIEMLTANRRIGCVRSVPRRASLAVSASIVDAFPGMPVLPLIGYNRSTRR